MDVRSYLKQSPLYNVIIVNSLVSTKTRKRIALVTETIIFSTILIMVVYYLVKDLPKFLVYQESANFIVPKLIGLLFISIGIHLYTKLLDLYISSQFYFEHVIKNKYTNDDLYTISAGKILYAGRNTDIIHGFFYSRIGENILARLGINKDESKSFIEKLAIIPEEIMPKQEGPILKLKDIIAYIYNNDAFKDFLTKKGITEEILLGALSWVIFDIEQGEYKAQWWRPEILAGHKRIATDWSFGRTFLLDKYSRELMLDEQVSSEVYILSEREYEISQIETTLSKSEETNTLLVGEPGQEKMQVIWGLCKKIRDKKISASLKNKRPILFLVNAMVVSCKDKASFEEHFVKIFNEISRAGNVLLVIDNFPLLLNNGKKLGIDIVSLLDPYLAGSAIKIIAISNLDEFHQTIETNKSLMNRFETIIVRSLSTEENTKIIANSSLMIEAKYNLTFTYQAILELAKSAKYYFPDGLSSDKAIDLLNEIAPWSQKKEIKLINKDEVLQYIEQKTNIPTSGKISTEEKEKLTNLENLLSAKVIGQKDAIYAIANSIRRARSGVRNPNKPIGSFLFLGPTGVGKTETSKALASVFFGSEENMIRFDMSEYQTADAMERLIGTFESNKSGTLSSALREKPFAVVLLDEFEKTNKDVLNLFLQILDEGFFSDTGGKRVSAKNIIFIATSNAGAENIFKMINDGRNPTKEKEEIIEDIISKGIFKPELINRFDGTVVFNPLENEDLKKIAKIMLSKLEKRMIEKGITIEINEDLINYVANNGSNKAFGARPMNRFIQDTVEVLVSNLIISGEANLGKTITFSIQNNTLLAKIK